MKESVSIGLSWLRLIATWSIVACHILKANGNHWDYIFNIGVQVFFLLSGYLYGHKFIEKTNGGVFLLTIL